MRVLVCGGRDFSDEVLAFKTLDTVLHKYPDMIVIQGMAKGADLMAMKWCVKREIATIGVPAEWGKYGKAAGMKRNKVMRDVWKPDACVAFKGGVGTKGMIALMREVGIEPWLVGWGE